MGSREVAAVASSEFGRQRLECAVVVYQSRGVADRLVSGQDWSGSDLPDDLRAHLSLQLKWKTNKNAPGPRFTRLPAPASSVLAYPADRRTHELSAAVEAQPTKRQTQPGSSPTGAWSRSHLSNFGLSVY
jgi:hypothetical protein